MLGTAIAIWFSGTGKCRRNYSLPMLEVAGSNPASAANDGRVAQRIERVTISPPLVAEVPPTGGCRQDYIVWKQRVRFPPPETAKSCQSSRPPFFRGMEKQMPWKLHWSQVQVLPRFRRVAQSVRAMRRFQKTRCLPCRPLKYFQVA